VSVAAETRLIPPGAWMTSFVAGGLAIVLAGLLALVTGPTLGMFFGGVFILTILLPPMLLCERSLLPQAVIASMVTDAIGLVWLLAAIRSPVPVIQWLQCYLLLAAYAFALWGLARCLREAGCPVIPAGALTTAVGLLWLTWPVWLARVVDAKLAAWLVAPHPLLSMNGVLPQLGIWTERPIAYRYLTTLGQDVPYQLPPGIATGVFIHLILGGLLFAMGSLRSGPDRP